MSIRHSRIEVVVFLGSKWDTSHRRSMLMALANAIGSQGILLCVDRPEDFLISPFRTLMKKGEIDKQFSFRKIQENLWLLRPKILLHEILAERFKLKPILGENVRRMKKSIFEAGKALGFSFQKPILWIQHPVQRHYIEIFKSPFVVYECYDEYGLNARGFSIPDFKRREAELLKKTEIVFVTSDGLYQSRKKRHPLVINIGNGVNFSFFRDEKKNTQPPADLEKIPHPRVLYVGNFYPLLDMNLIVECVKRLKDYSFLFLGPVPAGMKKAARLLSLYKNVYFLGARRYEEVVGYIANSDICLIPLLINEYTKNSNPLKCFEYLALGKPVVSTPLPEVAKFHPFVYIAANSEDFAKKISEGSRETEIFAGKRIDIAKQHDWKAIAEKVWREVTSTFKS